MSPIRLDIIDLMRCAFLLIMCCGFWTAATGSNDGRLTTMTMTTTTTTTTTFGPYSPSAVQKFVELKCGSHDGDNEEGSPFPFSLIRRWKRGELPPRTIGGKAAAPPPSALALWSYEGVLVDPHRGETVAEVEGLEWVRQLSECSISEKDGLNRLGNLSVRSLLRPGDWDYATTFLSRKLFCYKSPSSSGVLSSIQLHPHSPRREIPLQEATALYDTATTFISRRQGQELIVHTEWPDGRWCMASASASNRSSSSGSPSVPKKFPFEFSVYSRVRRKGEGFETALQVLQQPAQKTPASPRRRFQFWPLSKATNATAHNDDQIVLSSPPRSRWIQFGPDKSALSESRFGARETYSYTTLPEFPVRRWRFWPLRGGEETKKDPSSCRVYYTRYGEGPPWYGPGRMCSLELRGRRIASLDEAPPLSASLAAQMVTEEEASLSKGEEAEEERSMLSAHHNNDDEDTEAIRAVAKFRSSMPRLQESGNRNIKVRWPTRAWTGVSLLAQRLGIHFR